MWLWNEGGILPSQAKMEKPGNVAQGWKWLQPPSRSISQGPIFCTLWGDGNRQMEFGACVLSVSFCVPREMSRPFVQRAVVTSLYSDGDGLGRTVPVWGSGEMSFPWCLPSLGCQLSGFPGASLLVVGWRGVPGCETFSAEARKALGKPGQLGHLKFWVPWFWQVWP